MKRILTIIQNSKLNLILLALLFFLAMNTANAQQNGGTLRGFVFSSQGEPLPYATIIAFAQGTDNVIKGTVSDENGLFIINELPVGDYNIKISYVGYLDQNRAVTIEANKIISWKIELDEGLDGRIGPPMAEIWAPNFSPVLTKKELYAAPAVYDDPARTVALLAGVTNTNDQANHISVRGNNPNSTKWYLEGVEIPNPNHTPNAGTASDRITSSGGGVNMIKPQFLQSTAFFNGAFNTGFGNAVGGILDMNINREFPKERQTSIQIGLIGLEGLIKETINTKKNKLMYNASVRYSTVGLLTNGLGLDFGGEKISFMDANISAYLETKKYGDFSFFNISGISNNDFTAQRDTANWEVQKDRFDINFYSATSITGVSHRYFKGHHSWKTTVAYSLWNAVRNGNRLDENFNVQRVQQDSMRHRRFSFRTKYSYRNFNAELNATQLNYQLYNFDSLANFQANGTQEGWLLQPSLGYLLLNRNYRYLRLGVHSMIYTGNNSYSVEPRITYAQKLPRRRGDLLLSYGLHSQLQAPEVYLSANPSGDLINDQLGFTRSHHFNFKYNYDSRRRGLGVQFQTYYQYLFDIPIINAADRSFSVINDMNSFITDTLANGGVGQNYGIELAVRKNFRNDFYISANATLYQSQYKGGDNIWRNTRYNGNFIANLILGKDWNKAVSFKKNKPSQRKIGIYGRLVYAGGYQESPIDLVQSQQLGRTVFIENEAYSQQQPNIFKLDVRWYWEKTVFDETNISKIKRKHTVALDIQNATNQQNVAFNYFDPLQGQVITKYQLGLIPLLSWRLDF